MGNAGLALEPGVLFTCSCKVGALLGAPAVGNSGLALDPGVLVTCSCGVGAFVGAPAAGNSGLAPGVFEAEV